MTVILDLSADVESSLKAQAQMLGWTLEVYLQRVLNEQSTAPQSALPLSPDTWEQEFETWADSFPDTPPLSDEAISRASMYPDRW
jgi:hypothetical protein